MRRLAATVVVFIAILCAGCVQTSGNGHEQGQAPAPATRPALPPETLARPANPLAPDLSCKVAGDCAVKNVGNCCGYFPACVNRDSPVDPDAVRAECARTGTSAVCGFADIQACECVQGQCRATGRGPMEVDR